jgi:hypothetical protein
VALRCGLILALLEIGCIPSFDEVACYGNDECSAGFVCNAGVCEPIVAPKDASTMDGASLDADPPDASIDATTDASMDAAMDAAMDATPTDAAMEDSGFIDTSSDCVSLEFFGADRVSADYDPSMDAPDALTVEAWIIWDGSTSGARIASRSDDTSACSWFLDVYNGNLRFCVFFDCFTSQCVDSTPVPAGEWVHVAGQVDDTGITTYVGGVGSAILPRGVGALATSNAPLVVGDTFIGKIAGVRTSSIARYSGSFTPTYHFDDLPGAYAVWPLEEGTGRSAFDTSGSQNDGAIEGALWSRNGPACGGSFYAPFLPDASCRALLHFDVPTPLVQGCGFGADATTGGIWMTIPSRTANLRDAYELDSIQPAWIDTMKPGPMPPEATVELTFIKAGNSLAGSFACGTGTLYSDYRLNDSMYGGLWLMVDDDGSIDVRSLCRFSGGTSCGVTDLSTPDQRIQDARWYHVAVTLSDGTGTAPAGIAIFVDGTEAARSTTLPNWSAGQGNGFAGSLLNAGTGGPECGFNGAIDELRVSDVVRY